MRKIGTISIFIFLTCLFAGMFFSTKLSAENGTYLSSLLIYGISDTSAGFAKSLASSLTSALLPSAVVLSALFTKYLCPLPILFLSFKSFSLGFCSGLMYLGSADDPFMLSLLKLLPQNLFFIPAFLMLSSAVFCGSFTQTIKSNRPSRERKSLKNAIILSFCLMALGCVTESACRMIVL